MKVLLLKHKKGLGKVGEIVEVADGFAQNALFPTGIAKQATAAILNKHKLQLASEKLKAEKEKAAVLEAMNKLDGKTISIEEKLNAKNSLYHAVGAKEILRAMKEQTGLSLASSYFAKKYSFKDAGEHAIVLEAYGKKNSFIFEIKAK